MGRREFACLMPKDITSYTSSHFHAHLSGYRNQGRYGDCDWGLGPKRVSHFFLKDSVGMAREWGWGVGEAQRGTG